MQPDTYSVLTSSNADGNLIREVLLLIPILQVQKQRHTEVKQFVNDHKSS